MRVVFMTGERSSGPPLVRRAIRYEVQDSATEMAPDLRDLHRAPASWMPTLPMICGLWRERV